ncbi:MAG: hypothetical protein JXA78_01470 [Anaerolineales bacterium]|nr:hypothetical protein [Anaerolineales bacterium]
MYNLIVTALNTLNGLLTAGIAITAFSMLLYALSFNLRDRVARSFVIIMLCVVIVFVGEALSSVAQMPEQLEFWLRLQWVGIIFLPAAYMHLSDALLATTGRPSRGRRQRVVRLLYLVAVLFLLLLPSPLLIGELVQSAEPASHLQRTWLTWVFTVFYATVMFVSWINLWRAYKRTVTSTSQRRMAYLLAGALAPALGSYPYLVFTPGFASQHQLFFWLTVTLSNLLVSALLVLMAYAVAFFGVPWPDRIVKRRLLKWIMRGPVTASTVLAITTLIRRAGNRFGIDISAAVPAIMVASILILEHLITLAAPLWERWLFHGKDHADMQLLETLDERLLTLGDLRQFLESILAAVCDRLQVPKAFLATLGETQELEILVTIGGDRSLQEEDLSANLLQAVHRNGSSAGLFSWGDYWLAPLFDQAEETGELIGLLGVMRQAKQSPPAQALDDEQREALFILAERAALAISDRYMQQQAFSSLEELTPQMDMIQRLRAAARYDGTDILTSPDISLKGGELSPWVKDALTHYWGGPKLTQSPLLNLWVVQQAARESSENPTNALRTILREAIERVRPEGERRFTAEWILYNILEMKFMEGRKVREVAMRLAMSEADLYRKQRVAIEAVANAIIEMEQQAREELSFAVETNSQMNSPSKENDLGRWT